MLDDPVDDGSRKPGIVRSGHPRRQLLADVFVETLALSGAVEVLGGHGLLRLGMQYFAFVLQKHLAFVVLISVLDSHAPEESGEPPQILLRPPFPGLVLAAGSLH